MVLEKTLGSPVDSKETKLVNSKENQPWIFIGRTDAEPEPPIFWPPDAKNQLIGTDPDAGKDWRREEKGMTEDEMVGWHLRLNGHECEQTPREFQCPGADRPQIHSPGHWTDIPWTMQSSQEVLQVRVRMLPHLSSLSPLGSPPKWG